MVLDGSVRYHPKLVRDSTYVHPPNFSIPIIYFTGKEITLESIVQDHRDMSGNVLNDLVHSFSLRLCRFGGYGDQPFRVQIVWGALPRAIEPDALEASGSQ